MKSSVPALAQQGLVVCFVLRPSNGASEKKGWRNSPAQKHGAALFAERLTESVVALRVLS